MGQAKRRGTYPERKALAQIRQAELYTSALKLLKPEEQAEIKPKLDKIEPKRGHRTLSRIMPFMAAAILAAQVPIPHETKS